MSQLVRNSYTVTVVANARWRTSEDSRLSVCRFDIGRRCKKTTQNIEETSMRKASNISWPRD